MREVINLRGLGGENRTAGLRIHGLGFTESTEVLREDGQDVKMDYLPENSTERWTQRRTPPGELQKPQRAEDVGVHAADSESGKT